MKHSWGIAWNSAQPIRNCSMHPRSPWCSVFPTFCLVPHFEECSLGVTDCSDERNLQKNQFVNDSATCLLCVWIKMTKPPFLFLFFTSKYSVFVFCFFFLSLSLCCCKVATVLGLDLLNMYLHVVVVVVDQWRRETCCFQTSGCLLLLLQNLLKSST